MDAQGAQESDRHGAAHLAGKGDLMNKDIEAIFLDVGHTLRVVVPEPAFMQQARQDLMTLVGTTDSESAFFGKLDANWKAYRQQSIASLVEASEKELWTKWLLPDYPAEKIGPLSGRLTRLWRDHDGRRVPRPDVNSTIIELDRRGYRLGILANTITETEIPDWMEREGIRKYFKAVVLSSKVRYRKPGTEIYHEAARRIGVEPARCAYLGDNPIRDVEGTVAAGFGMMIIMEEPGGPAKQLPPEAPRPDFVIHQIRELLDIFPTREPARAAASK